MAVEAIDAPRAEVPVQIRWHKTVPALLRVGLPDRDLYRAEPDGVPPRALLGTWVIRWAIDDSSCFYRLSRINHTG